MLTVDYLEIESFRKFEEKSKIEIGKNLTLIVGQNATSKSTVLVKLFWTLKHKN